MHRIHKIYNIVYLDILHHNSISCIYHSIFLYCIYCINIRYRNYIVYNFNYCVYLYIIVYLLDLYIIFNYYPTIILILQSIYILYIIKCIYLYII